MRITIAKIWLVAALISIGFANMSFAEPIESGAAGDGKQIEDEHIEDTNEIKFNKDYLKGYISDTKSILTSPTRWEKPEWIKASLVLGITAGLYAWDQDIQDWAQVERDNTSDKIANLAKPFGSGFYTIPPLAAFYVYGHFFENEKARKTALLSLESFVISGAFTQIIKFSAHRHRPSSGDSYNTWGGPGFSTDHLSFISGHSSSAFSIATVIASEYDDNMVIPPLAYGIATLTALSRVHDNAHWASDAFLGSAVGYFTAKAIVNLHDDQADSRVTILPMIGDEGGGLLISYQF